jgi:hypothetical protein
MNFAGDYGAHAVNYVGEKGIDRSRVPTRTSSGQAAARQA